MRMVLERRLLSWGYTVVMANDGEEVIRAAAARAPDLILLDVMMPKLDGFAVCRQLKSAEQTRRIPIVLVTAKASQLSPDQVRSAGAVGLLPKPYEAEDLLKLVRSALAETGDSPSGLAAGPMAG
jgi:CheY-like chemotaxis protein